MVEEGRTSPANLVRIVTCAIPIGMSADYAFEIIAVIVDATLPKYFSLIVMSPKVSSIGWFYLETRFSSTPSLNLHLLFPSTIWGFFRAHRSTRALLTPDIDVCGRIAASVIDGNVLMYVGTYHTCPIVDPLEVNYYLTGMYSTSISSIR